MRLKDAEQPLRFSLARPFLVGTDLGTAPCKSRAGELPLADQKKRTLPADESDPPASPRLGLVLFSIYLLFYLVFVFISAFACDLFEFVLPGGLNLAVVYGFGLIALALVLAMVYGGMRRAGS